MFNVTPFLTSDKVEGFYQHILQLAMLRMSCTRQSQILQMHLLTVTKLLFSLKLKKTQEVPDPPIAVVTRVETKPKSDMHAVPLAVSGLHIHSIKCTALPTPSFRIPPSSISTLSTV